MIATTLILDTPIDYAANDQSEVLMQPISETN